MVTRQMRSVDIQGRDDFDELLRSLAVHSSSTLTIDVASSAEALEAPEEFEELYLVAQHAGVEIEFVTDDPVRHELARIYGMRAFPEPVNRLRVRSEAPTLPEIELVPIKEAVSAEKPTERLSAPAAPQMSASEAREASASKERFDSASATDASFSFVTAVGETERFTSAPHSVRARRPTEKRIARSLGTGSIVVSAVAVAAAVAILMLALFAPSASIVIVPQSQGVSAEVTYGLAGSGSAVEVSVAPVPIAQTLTFEATMPTTGESMVPDAPARGMIFLSSPQLQEVDVAGGTTIVSDTGQTYITVEAVTIPAADPFGSARFGTAVVGIEAAMPGPEGNMGTDELMGTLENGISFQNRFPIEGGTLKGVSVVSQSDIDNLVANAEHDLLARVDGSLVDQIPADWMLVNRPTHTGEIVKVLSSDVGAVADSLTIRATLDVSGEIYNPGELEAAARDRLLGTLTGATPEGFGLQLGSIRMTTPQPVEGLGGPALAMRAEGNAIAQFDSTFESQLRSELVGKGEEQASSIVGAVSGVESFSTTYGPEWLPWNPVPRFTNRVSIEIDGT